MRKPANPALVKLLFLLIASSAMPVICLAQNGFGKDSALLPESWARKPAANAVMPTYPDEAASQGISGVVRIRFETNPAGEVVTIKVKPGTDPLLRKAVVKAVRQWKFKPSLGVERQEVPVFSRLAFRFIIRKGEPQVEMYDPGPRAAICLACSSSYKEMIEWNEWEVAWSKSDQPQSLRSHFLEINGS